MDSIKVGIFKMQSILIVEQSRDLYHFLAALAETSYSHLSEPKFANKNHDANRVMLWSQGTHSELLDSYEKLEIVERHARKLGIHIVLSAASNQALRNWANEIGWTVLWEVSGLDHAMNATTHNYQIQEQEMSSSIAS